MSRIIESLQLGISLLTPTLNFFPHNQRQSGSNDKTRLSTLYHAARPVYNKHSEIRRQKRSSHRCLSISEIASRLRCSPRLMPLNGSAAQQQRHNLRISGYSLRRWCAVQAHARVCVCACVRERERRESERAKIGGSPMSSFDARARATPPARMHVYADI